MAFALRTPVVRNFYGLSFVEKKTFLHFEDESTEYHSKSRSRSVPAMAKEIVDSPHTKSMLAMVSISHNMESLEPVAIDPVPAFIPNPPVVRVSIDLVPAVVPNAPVVRDPSGANAGQETTPAPSDPDPSVELKMHAEEIACSSPQEQGLSSNWDNMEEVHNVMIRGIPTVCSSAEILNAVDELGFINLYDFFFVPTRIQKKKTKNIGYCFIGFPSTEDAKNFAKTMTGYRFRESSPKLVTVEPAAIQGLQENFSHFSNTQVMRCRKRPRPLFVRGSYEILTS